MKFLPITIAAFPTDNDGRTHDGIAVHVPGDDTTLEEHLQKVEKALVGVTYRDRAEHSFAKRIAGMYRDLKFPSDCRFMVCVYPADLVQEGHMIGTTRVLMFPASTLDDRREEIIEREAKNACEWILQFYKDWREGKVSPVTNEGQSVQ